MPKKNSWMKTRWLRKSRCSWRKNSSKWWSRCSWMNRCCGSGSGFRHCKSEKYSLRKIRWSRKSSWRRIRWLRQSRCSWRKNSSKWWSRCSWTNRCCGSGSANHRKVKYSLKMIRRSRKNSWKRNFRGLLNFWTRSSLRRTPWRKNCGKRNYSVKRWCSLSFRPKSVLPESKNLQGMQP